MIRSELASGSRGATFFDRLQYFPLCTMSESGLLSREQISEQLACASRLRPQQITFIEVSHWVTRARLASVFAELPDFARRCPWEVGVKEYFSHFDTGEDVLQEGPDDRFQLKVGSVYLVAGQASGETLTLPLENDAAGRPALEHALDRRTMPWVFEIGRGTGISEGAFDEAVQKAVYLALWQTFAAGGRAELAYVFGHAMKPRFQQFYEKKFGGRLFSRVVSRPDEAIVYANLAEMAETVGLKASAKELQTLELIAGRSLSAAQLVELKFLAAESTHSTFESGGVRVEMRNFSLAPSLRLQARVQALGLAGDRAQALLQALMRFREPLPESRDFAYRVAQREAYPYVVGGLQASHADQTLWQFLKSQRGIELRVLGYKGDLSETTHQLADFMETFFGTEGVRSLSAAMFWNGPGREAWYVRRPQIETLSHFAFGAPRREVLRRAIAVQVNSLQLPIPAAVERGVPGEVWRRVEPAALEEPF